MYAVIKHVLRMRIAPDIARITWAIQVCACSVQPLTRRVEQSSSDLKSCCQHLANFALRYADAVESVMAGHEVNAMPTLDEEEAEE